ncbi:MAG: outer membrane protein assembly factor BamC [Methylococcaceae bacterium]
MKTKIRSLVIVAVALANISACSTIKNLFPDKEKDYQFTTEIPPLVLPPDLSGDAIAKIPAAPATETPDTAPSAPVSETPDAARATPTNETTPAVDRKLIQVELIDAEQGAKRLHISAPSEIAWRMVGKALSRKSIEVTNRNQDERLFDVQYDQSRQDAEDGSFWDEIVFAFKGFEVDEQAFIVKLVENDRQTDVIILDKEQKPVSDGASLSLLTLLYDTLKADLAK